MTLPIKPRSRLYEELILKSWWLILFFLVVYFAYDVAIQRRDREERRLREKFSIITESIEIEQERKEEVKLAIRSRQDPESIELTLRKKLGVISEKETKVLFPKKAP
ncbi:MAG: hypothetical protein K940chlam9_01322 [Chlamydiae bacterium]|nr:hypothetical protein [Chlamydiota bacterium]